MQYLKGIITKWLRSVDYYKHGVAFTSTIVGSCSRRGLMLICIAKAKNIRYRRKMQKNIGQPASKFGPLVGAFAIVCIMVLVVHWPVLEARALSFDDNQYLTDNPLVRNPGWASAKRFLTEVLEPSTVEGYYQPLTMLSLMLDYALGGRSDNLEPFHRSSLAIHMANAVLVTGLLYLLFGRIWLAAGLGLLFGLHPMTVEPVAWVGERKTLLAGFFSLWCLILYVQFAAKKDWRFYIGSLAMYILALMSKPISLPLPVLMLLMDFWPLKRLNRQTVLEKVPLLATGCVFAAVTYISQSRTAAVTLPFKHGLGRILLVIGHNIMFYIYKIVWPVNLSPHYAYPKPLALSNPTVLMYVIGSCFLIAMLLVSLRWTPVLLTGWLFFFAAIFPTLGIIGFTIVIASDKFAYLPSLGFLMILAALFGWFCGHGRVFVRRTTVIIIVLALAGAESVATRRYLVHWHDTVSLYEHTLTLTPNAPLVHYNLGCALWSLGRSEEAISHFTRTIELKPDYVNAYNNLGLTLWSQGRFDEAIGCYQQAIRIQPDDTKAYNNLGLALKSKGKFDQAIDCYRQVLRIDPNDAIAYNNIGIALSAQGNFDEAVSHFRQALKLDPAYAEAHYNLGKTFCSQGKDGEAIGSFLLALQLKPDLIEARSQLGTALQSQGRIDEAISQYQMVLQLRPDYAPAHNNLGTALQLQGKLDQAISHYRRALELRPDYDLAGRNLQLALEAKAKLYPAPAD
jgi:tetratricopeptide (TPR) repeat protein